MNIRAKIYGGANSAEEPIMKAKRRKGAKADTLASVAVMREEPRANAAGARTAIDSQTRRSGSRATAPTTRCELINLSGGGAMIGGGVKLNAVGQVELHLGENGDIECVVRWIRDGRYRTGIRT